MKDINDESDIRILVDAFYRKVLVDPVIGFIFTEIADLSWEKHMPVMYAFWSSTLLGVAGYNSNPMEKHFHLDKKIKLEKAHFDQWLKLWEETVHELFSGKTSEEAISRAKNIAALMHHKIAQQRNINS
ncbi:MAG: group III truncated hemoglobin [Chitinophagales bacterium]